MMVDTRVKRVLPTTSLGILPTHVLGVFMEFIAWVFHSSLDGFAVMINEVLTFTDILPHEIECM